MSKSALIELHRNIDADALAIGNIWRSACQSLVDSTRYYIECGQRLNAKKESVGHGEWLPWLKANAEVLGFNTPRIAQRLMETAANTTLASHLDEATATAINRQLHGHDKVGVAKRYERTAGPDGACCGFEELHRLVAEGVTFGNLYVDPPWLYDNQATRAATGNHYDGLTVDQLCDPDLMPVAKLAAANSHLHLWTTNAFLFECPRIFDAWGFEFKSTFVWVKSEIGLGNYWRNAHEILLTAVRGNAERFDVHDLRSWVECSRGRHSDKPDQVRNFIARSSPTPRIELFARSEHDGWLSWGNEIDKTLFSKRVNEVA
jgi:N6-adenosine-specific RNA methylase IME4